MRLTDEPFWEEWTAGRALLAVLWLAFTGVLGLFLFFLGGWYAATVEGVPPTPSEFRTAAGLTVIAGAVAAAGPFGIGLLRKTGVPKGIAAGVFALFLLAAAYYLVKSL